MSIKINVLITCRCTRCCLPTLLKKMMNSSYWKEIMCLYQLLTKDRQVGEGENGDMGEGEREEGGWGRQKERRRREG